MTRATCAAAGCTTILSRYNPESLCSLCKQSSPAPEQPLPIVFGGGIGYQREMGIRRRADMLTFLERTGASTANEIATALGCTSRTVRNHAEPLMREGQIVARREQVNGGFRFVYSLPEELSEDDLSELMGARDAAA